MKALVLSILFLSILLHAEQCKHTHLDVFTQYSLGQTDEMNKTFTYLQQTIKVLDNVTYTPSGSTSYKVGNVKPIFFFFDARQQVNITGNDTIVVHGGRLDVRLPFQFSINRSGAITSGSGQAFAISDDTVYSKNISVDKGYIVYEIQKYHNISFEQNGVFLVRTDPPNIPKEDLDVIFKMFNQQTGLTTVKDHLEHEIDKSFFYYLNKSLYDEKRHITDHFQYTWEDPIKTKGNLTIQYEISDVQFDVETDGLRGYYTARIKNYPGWKCQINDKLLPLNTKLYGSQEALTFDMYKNTLRYGIQHHFLDTTLTKEHWESRMFQFYAGDLYQVIPKTAQKFLANEEVGGSCKASTSNLSITRGTIHEAMNVTIDYDCTLNVAGFVVGKFNVNLIAVVEGKARSDHINFEVIGFSRTVKFESEGGYEVQNVELAQQMITHSLNRLKEGHVFGSKWPIYRKDYPHFIVEENRTIVYDSTHVDPTIRTE